MRMPQSHGSLSRRNIQPGLLNCFKALDVQITREGQKHLGAALGSQTFVETYVTGKVQEWVREVERLAALARSQPHAAYAAMTHGLSSKWTYLSRMIPNIMTSFSLLRMPCATNAYQLSQVEVPSRNKRETC